MKVLLLHYADAKSKLTEPLGICYIAAYLRSKGIETDIFDSRTNEYTLEEYIKKVNERCCEYGLIGISTSQLFGKKNETWAVQQIVENIRKTNYKGHITAGGYGPTINWEKFLDIGVDSVSLGEGEINTYNLARALENNEDWKSINGFSYIADNGEKIKNPQGVIPDFEALPFPARDILEGFTKKYGIDQMNPLIQGSRGCYMKCAYCSTPVYLKMQGGPVYRNRSISNVVDEIEILYKKGYTIFDFVDDNFLPPKPEDAINRATELRDELKKRNIVASFYMEFRLEYITKELLNILKQVGVRKLLIGVESFNQKDLKLYNRTYPTERMHNAINAILEAGYGADLNSKYRLRFGFINTNPLSTIDTLRTNITNLHKYQLTYKKLITRLFLYDNNSIILKNVLEQFPEYSIDNYFKYKRVGAFYDLYSEYDKKYVAYRNKGRNIEKFINKRVNAGYSDLDYEGMMGKLINMRQDLDNAVYLTYTGGLDAAEKDDYITELSNFFEERHKEFEAKRENCNLLLRECSRLLSFEFFENEMFFN